MTVNLKSCVNEVGLTSFYHTTRDVKLICLLRSTRMFGYGALTLVLATFLRELHISPTGIGFFMTLTLTGDVILSFFLALFADSLGRRAVLGFGASLIIVSGVAFALSSNYWVLLGAAILGILSPNGGETGPFRAIEESTVAHLTDSSKRSDIYAWYNVSGTIGSAIGMITCGWVIQYLRVSLGWPLLDSYRVMFCGYAAIGVVKIFLVSRLTQEVELRAGPRESARSSSGSTVAEAAPLLGGNVSRGGEDEDLDNLYFRTYHGLDEGALGTLFFTLRTLAAISMILASSLAKRFGNVKTMVFTHLPSALFLALIPIPSDVHLSITFLLLRSCLQSMSIAPRSAFIAAMVLPEERTALMGMVNVCHQQLGSHNPFARFLPRSIERFLPQRDSSLAWLVCTPGAMSDTVSTANARSPTADGHQISEMKGTGLEVGEFSDSEKYRSDLEVGDAGLERALSSRHLQFIAIGGTIGTGLFLGLGNALATAGPVSLVIAFIFIGTVVYSVMVSLGEMAAYMPVAGSFTVYANRLLDPALGFSLGWMYWFSWNITFALELTAAGLIIQYWLDTLSIAVWIMVFWVVFTGLNFMPVRWFGEIEMWFSSIKVVTVMGFIIFAICVNAGVGDEGYIGFKYWQHPGPFAEYMVEGATGKFVGFWAVLVTAAFTFQGAELVGVGAGETKNPGKSIPSAIRWTFWGIFVLFVATVFFVSINLPFDLPELTSDKSDASASPLVIIAQRAGVPVLAHILNAVLLTAVLSAANSNVYSCSRILVALAEEGLAPKFVSRTNRYGTPYIAVALCSILGLLGLLNLSQNGTQVFNWLLNISSTSALITWAGINGCHIRFLSILKAQSIDRVTLPWRAPFSRGCRVVCRTKFVPVAEADLAIGRVVY
ncbi:unnamed protein product [Parascedosporium putredinis]|uniref:Amino acid permease/ SLC12A domain-containing protein n=1 Tax=Parascedosporium putredinis TaxID=1442378 RepID=A0A9P1HAT2_9PEZI|nr:unnamed protein product [Parascedosporium putredinis]CAI8004302.1 unnamed protein product [Parascedosporium putredinis]